MPDLTDNREEAEQWLAASSIWESPDERSVPMMLAALTHAVLALADAVTNPTPANPQRDTARETDQPEETA